MTLKAKTPADLLDKIRAVEGWPRVEGDSLTIIKRAKETYALGRTLTHYTATKK